MKQWSFLPGRCTASALITVTHDWLQQLELGNEVCSVFFDLKKAIDSVPYRLLLRRLDQISVDHYIVQWMEEEFQTTTSVYYNWWFSSSAGLVCEVSRASDPFWPFLVPSCSQLVHQNQKLISFLYRRFGKLADSSTLLQIYKSFIRPHLEYCSMVWDPYLIGDIEVLEKVQRFALRVCLKNWSCDQEELYVQSNILALAERWSHARLYHIYKIVNHLTDFPESPFEFRVLHYNYRYSHSLQLRSITTRTSQFQHSFFFPGTIPLWDSLPHSTVSAPTLPSFISHL